MQIASLNVANDVAFNLSGLQTGAQVRLRVKLKVSTVGGRVAKTKAKERLGSSERDG